jgi:hypothetical protein
MSRITIFAIDLVAVALLVFGPYFPRHRRRDLVAAYLDEVRYSHPGGAATRVGRRAPVDAGVPR